MAEVARLCPYRFARQIRRATGLPPHQYVITRHLERAKQFLEEGELRPVRVTLHAGFADPSHICRHFERLVGVTPGQFRTPARLS